MTDATTIIWVLLDFIGEVLNFLINVFREYRPKWKFSNLSSILVFVEHLVLRRLLGCISVCGICHKLIAIFLIKY